MTAYSKIFAGSVGAGFVALGLVGSAQADGYAAPGRVAYERPYTWSGIYAGGQVGWIGADYSWAWDITPGNPGFPATGVSPAPGSWGGGGQVGVQGQWGNLVAGVEVSYTSANLKDQAIVANSFGVGGLFKGFESHADWAATITPKLGWAMGPWLGYVKAGYAIGGVQLKTFNSTATTFGLIQTSSRGDLDGWTVGAGIEYKLLKHVSLGVEYDFIRLNAGTRNLVSTFNGTVASNHMIGDVDRQEVMARLNFHLAPAASAPLK